MEKINEEKVRLLLRSAKRYREKAYDIDTIKEGIMKKAEEIEYDLNKNWQGKIIKYPEKSVFRNGTDQQCYEILYMKINTHKMLYEYYFEDKDEPFLQQGKIPVEIHMYKHGDNPRVITGKGMEQIRKAFKNFEENSDRNRYIYNKPHCDFYQKWKGSTETVFNTVVCSVGDLHKKRK